MNAYTSVRVLIFAERDLDAENHILLKHLRDVGFDACLTSPATIHDEISSGDVLVFDVTASRDPLSYLAQLWCAEPDIPVIALGDGDQDTTDAALRAGVTAVVQPPHRADEVHFAIKTAIAQRQGGFLMFNRRLARTMSAISALIGEAEDDSFLQPVLERVVDLFEVERASILILEDPEDADADLRIRAHTGFDDDPSDVRIPAGKGIAGRVLADGIPQLLLRSVTADARFPKRERAQEIVASLAVPVRSATDSGLSPHLGVINLARRAGDRNTSDKDIFTPRDLEVCEFIASALGQALSRLALDKAQAALQQKLGAVEKLAYAGELAAGIAHEVASPVGYVKANLKVLSEYLEDLQPLLEHLKRSLPQNPPPGLSADEAIEILDDIPSLVDECSTGIDRATQIVADMKAMVRVGPEGEKKKERVSMAQVVESTLHLLRPRLADRCQVKTELDADVHVMGNEVELSQVLVNLVVNASDACIERKNVDEKFVPMVTVSVTERGPQCALRVRDNGVGISADDLARIFAPLFTTKPSGVGTGLGLGIVKRIVESHEGSIHVSSTPNVGTQFEIVFPLERAASSEEVTPTPHAASGARSH